MRGSFPELSQGGASLTRLVKKKKTINEFFNGRLVTMTQASEIFRQLLNMPLKSVFFIQTVSAQKMFMAYYRTSTLEPRPQMTNVQVLNLKRL